VLRAVPVAVLLALAVSSAAADTIVLKNGRRIVAAIVLEEGDKVTGETSAGRFTIPQSIVERIERDNLSSSTTTAAVPPTVSAPQLDTVSGYDEVIHMVVHNDAIDFNYLLRLDSEAHSGAANAVEKVAAAHHTAAQFFLAKGSIDDAIEQYRQALTFAPDNVGLLLNLAVLYLRRSQFTTALDPLERARRSAPDSADVAKLMGWAYYGANKIDQAVEEWNRAERLHPDPEVEQALRKAQRDKSEEEGYREGETVHFSLKYYGGAAPDLARGILRALEDDFRDLASQLDYTPPEPIGVILYTEESFADITRAPSWVGALNDGRIRIPVQGLTSVTPDLARVLKHELTHSFVGQKSHGRAPTWLQEGIAQWMEGRRSSSNAAEVLTAATQGDLPSFETLEGSWMGLTGDSAVLAYAWSLAAVESIIQAGSTGDISRLLDRIATMPSTGAALREALHIDYPDLELQTIANLKREYAR
jgi:tetratricopeptide (TPR) repeat protein